MYQGCHKFQKHWNFRNLLCYIFWMGIQMINSILYSFLSRLNPNNSSNYRVFHSLTNQTSIWLWWKTKNVILNLEFKVHEDPSPALYFHLQYYQDRSFEKTSLIQSILHLLQKLSIINLHTNFYDYLNSWKSWSRWLFHSCLAF